MILAEMLVVAIHEYHMLVTLAEVFEEADSEPRIPADVSSYHADEAGAQASPILDIVLPEI
jgi:hypothetical protein